MRNHASLVPDSAGMAGSALVREHAASETWQAYMELNTKIWHAANRGDGAARSRKETNNRMEKLKPCPFCGNDYCEMQFLQIAEDLFCATGEGEK
jgi:hypothetical protein